MTTFQVDSEAVAAATSGVQASIGRIQGEVSSLLSQLIGLQSSWTGVAATSFQGVIGDWKATQHRVEESIALINSALAQAGHQYSEVELANQRLFLR